MNEVILCGSIRNIKHSHTIDNIEYDKAELIVPNYNGNESCINIKYKKFSNSLYKDGDYVSLSGNIRSYFCQGEDHNKLNLYVFTYFDSPSDNAKNYFSMDGILTKIEPIFITKHGKHTIHFTVKNVIEQPKKDLVSRIPCVAYGNVAKEISSITVGSKVVIHGEMRSREYKKYLSNDTDEFVIKVAHELVVTSYEVIE